MKKKYKEFSEKFDKLCSEYANEDFECEKVKEICNEIIDTYGE